MALQIRRDGVISSDLYDAKTTDGVLFLDLLAEADDFVREYNRRKAVALSFLGRVTTDPTADIVSQVTASWMRFSEFGKPSARNRQDYDVAVTTAVEGYQTAIEWTSFAELLGLPARVIRAHVRGVVKGDLQRTYQQLWEQFFDNVARPVEDILLKRRVVHLPFYNGDDRVPPPNGNVQFAAGHNHYLRAAGSGNITAADLNAGIETVTEHGYDNDVYIFGNQATVNEIMALGEPDIATIQAMHRLIPMDAVNANQPGALVPVSVPVNALFTAVGVFQGKATIAVAKDVSAGYIGFFSHQGPLSEENPLLLRLSDKPQLQGLRREGDSAFPFAGTYWQNIQGINTGRYGNGAAMQWIWTGGSAYQVPTFSWS